MLTLYRRGRFWYVRGTIAGRPIHQSTGETDQGSARQVRDQIVAQALRQGRGARFRPLTFAGAVNLYLAAQKSDRFLLPLLDHWRDTPVAEITGAAIRQAAIDIYPAGSAATRNRQVITPARAVINHAAELDRCAFVRVARFREQPARKTPASLEWIEAYTAAATSRGRPADAAMEWFMYLTAARLGQAVRLTWSDLDLGAGTAILRAPKGDGDQVVNLPPVLVAAIASLPGERETWRKVFRYACQRSVYKQRRATCTAAGIQYLPPHSARHGFATGLLRAGVDPVTAATLGRWKSRRAFVDFYCHEIEDASLVERLLDPPAAPARSAAQSKAK